MAMSQYPPEVKFNESHFSEISLFVWLQISNKILDKLSLSNLLHFLCLVLRFVSFGIWDLLFPWMPNPHFLMSWQMSHRITYYSSLLAFFLPLWSPPFDLPSRFYSQWGSDSCSHCHFQGPLRAILLYAGSYPFEWYHKEEGHLQLLWSNF